MQKVQMLFEFSQKLGDNIQNCDHKKMHNRLKEAEKNYKEISGWA